MLVKRHGNQVLFHPETLGDISALKKFPGLVETNVGAVCPAKGPIFRNIYSRITKENPKITFKVSENVNSLFKVAALEDIPADFQFHTEPLRHQLIALKFLHTNRGGGLLLDPGLGKTKVCLDFIKMENFRRVLIVCPKALTFVWEEEIAKHRPELSFFQFTSTSTSQLPEARTRTVWIMNYRKAALMQEALMDENFDAIFIDEGLVKDPTSDQTEALTKLSKKIPVRVIMSGTLVNNNEGDIFAPIRIMEPSIVGWNYGKFRDAYMSVWQPYGKSEDKKHIKVVTGAKEPEVLKAMLRACSIIMRKEEWLDLPPKEFVHIKVPMPTETMALYFDFLRNYITTIGGKTIEVDNPLAMMAKLSQFGNGFLYLDQNEGVTDLFLSNKKPKKSKKDREVYFFPEQPKVTALKELVQEKLKKKKFVLWYTMDGERMLIESALKDMGINFVTIAGGDKQVQEKVKAFNTSNEVQVLLAQARTLNYGVTLLGDQDDNDDFVQYLDPAICDMVFYSVGYSLEIFLQQQDRIHRIGQKNKCTYYILIADTPTEVKLIRALEDKQVIRSVMLENWIHEIIG